MSYFDPLEDTEVIVDASPVGLDATHGDAGLRIISYASRAITRDVLLRGTCIVTPPSLRPKVIKLAHVGHQGLVK